MGDKQLSAVELAATVATKAHAHPLIFIKADKEAYHGKVVEIIDAVKKAGQVKYRLPSNRKGNNE